MVRLIRHDRPAQLAAAAWVLAGVVPLSALACRAADSTSAPANVLLFNGRGTSPNDVAAVKRSLHDSHLSYSIADSPRLDAMDEPELRAYRLLIVPGGNFEQIGYGLKPQTTARLRSAIRHGLNYLGLCAGAFFAGDSPFNGLNLMSGVRFTFYAAENLGVHKAAIPIAIAGSLALDNYWEDGPQFTGWGSVVGRYPDGKPAIVEGRVGEGWAILSGVHPEAPDSWRRGLTFATPAVIDNAYAETLIDAALNGRGAMVLIAAFGVGKGSAKIAPSALGVVMPLFHWAMPSRYHSIHKNDLARAMVAQSEQAFLALAQGKGPAAPAVKILEYKEMEVFFVAGDSDAP